MRTMQKYLMVQKFQVIVEIPNRDSLTLEGERDGDRIVSYRLHAKGCPDLLRLAESWRDKLKGDIKQLAAPVARDHCSLLLKELLFKLKGQWDFPYKESELCHCRVVPAHIVDEAVMMGADSIFKVSRKTSAGTGCGTCHKDIEAVICFRQK